MRPGRCGTPCWQPSGPRRRPGTTRTSGTSSTAAASVQPDPGTSMRGMAILYPKADLQPSKLELLAPWLPTRAWYRGPAGPTLTRVAGYRFDDPEGEVGVETL